MNNNEILEEIKKISVRLDKIENDISYLKNGTDNMNNHISFIENVYDTIKYPFYSIINKFHKINQIPDKKTIEYNNL
jgi:archaellum component FlaC